MLKSTPAKIVGFHIQRRGSKLNSVNCISTINQNSSSFNALEGISRFHVDANAENDGVLRFLFFKAAKM